MNGAEQQNLVRTVVNRIADACGLTHPWPDADATIPEWVKDANLAAWGVTELGTLREAVIPKTDRDKLGVFHTPVDVASAMARFTLSPQNPILAASQTVRLDTVMLDPACGAGVFLIAAARRLAHTYACVLHGTENPPPWMAATVLPHVMETCVWGMDIDPVAVDLARAACWLECRGTRPITFMDDHIVTGDPLNQDMPKLLAERLATTNTPLVILANPPYGQNAKGASPWIEGRRTGSGDELFPRPSLDEFRVPGNRSQGILLNLWTLFWRWSAWKVFEQRPDAGGWLALLTPSSYIGGDVYRGLRAHMRRVADEGWIIDLSPEGHQAPRNTRIFPDVQTPVAISVFTRTSRLAALQEAA